MINLTAAGLTPTEAKCYETLLEKPEWKPAELAKSVGETRTNCYKILDKLVGYQLAERYDKDKVLHYRATNPSHLFELARQQRLEREQSEKQLELDTNNLIQKFIHAQEQPGVRYYQGEHEIGDIFTEIAQAHDEVVFVHTLAGIDFYGFAAMHNLRMLAPLAGVNRRALTPDGVIAPQDYKAGDAKVALKRTWLKKDDYTAPVEWGAFDNKLYIISYGKEAMGMVIESQQIAEAFKQLFLLLERGQKLLPGYEKLPLHASKRSVTTPKL